MGKQLAHDDKAKGLVLVSSEIRPDMKTDTDVVNSSDSHGAPEKRANAARSRKRPPMDDEGHVGEALRSVYQRAVNEDIPAEMLDLLSKLN